MLKLTSLISLHFFLLQDELNAELEELEQEEFDEKMLDVDIDELPQVPSEPLPATKSKCKLLKKNPSLFQI